MKSDFFIVITVTMSLAIASCKSKQQKDAENYMNEIQKTMKENSPAQSNDQQKPNSGSFTMPHGMENITGEWDLVMVFADDNGDHKVDAGEDDDATTNLRDYLKLNADGTCEYTIAKMKGTYEIITKDDGRKRLTMYDRTGTETTKGRYIISVTDKEMVINRLMGGSDFEIFRRL